MLFNSSAGTHGEVIINGLSSVGQVVIDDDNDTITLTVNTSSISDCVELYETRVANLFATCLLFENIDTAGDSHFNIENDFTVEADGQTGGSYFNSYWLSAQGVSMPRKSNAITIILPNEDDYTITDQRLTISYYNEDTGEEKSKTYRMIIEMPTE